MGGICGVVILCGDIIKKKEELSETSIFELPRVKNRRSRLCTNPSGAPPPPLQT